MLFWEIGKRINDDILENKRADYGKQIVAVLATQLTEQYGENEPIGLILCSESGREEIELLEMDKDGITGTTFGEYIEEKLDLKNAPGPFHIEFFNGSSDFSAPYANFDWNGLFEFLQPYFDSGQLVVPSGQSDAIATATEGMFTEKAYERMKELIVSQKYGPAPQNTRLDAVLCLTDSIAQGVAQALLEAGYTADNFPIITGWWEGGAIKTVESAKNIIAGTQTMSIFEDPYRVADRAVQMVTSILNGEEPKTNNNKKYYNDMSGFPAYFCEFIIVTRENYQEVLIDSGYYTEEELHLL